VFSQPCGLFLEANEEDQSHQRMPNLQQALKVVEKITYHDQQSVMQCMEKIHEVVNTTPPTNKSSSPKFGTPKKSSKMKPGEEEDEDSTPTKVLDVAKQN